MAMFDIFKFKLPLHCYVCGYKHHDLQCKEMSNPFMRVFNPGDKIDEKELEYPDMIIKQDIVCGIGEPPYLISPSGSIFKPFESEKEIEKEKIHKIYFWMLISDCTYVGTFPDLHLVHVTIEDKLKKNIEDFKMIYT